MVANLVERDMRRVPVGTPANVEVDAYPGRDLQGPRQPRRAGVRPGNAHRGDRNRGAERRLPPQAGHVFARAADGQHAQQTRSRCRATRSSISNGQSGVSSPPPPRSEKAESTRRRRAWRPERDEREVRAGRSRHSRRRSHRDQQGSRGRRAGHHDRRQRAQRWRSDRAAPPKAAVAKVSRRRQAVHSPRGAADEHSSSRDSTSGHDVHDQCGHHAARRRSRCRGCRST